MASVAAISAIAIPLRRPLPPLCQTASALTATSPTNTVATTARVDEDVLRRCTVEPAPAPLA